MSNNGFIFAYKTKFFKDQRFALKNNYCPQFKL